MHTQFSLPPGRYPIATWTVLHIVPRTYAIPGYPNRTLTDAELAPMLAALAEFPAQVSRWSGGMAAIAQTVAVPTASLTASSSFGPGRWVPKSDASAIRAELGADAYDSNMLYAPLAQVPMAYSGLSVYDGLTTPGWSAMVFYEPDAVAGSDRTVRLHEWMHPVLAYLAALGLTPDTNIDAAGSYTDFRDGLPYDATEHDSWFLFLGDVLRRQARRTADNVLCGIGEAGWALGTPVS